MNTHAEYTHETHGRVKVVDIADDTVSFVKQNEENTHGEFEIANVLEESVESFETNTEPADQTINLSTEAISLE